MSDQHCNQCENQCPVESLRCNRGRIHFGQEPVERKKFNGALGLLQKCGFVLHHGSLSPEEALTALNDQEQSELERMLTTLLADWEKRMPGGLPKPHHGGHH